MKHSYAILITMMSLLLAGCRGPQVAFEDMSPPPTASVSGSMLTVYIGIPNIQSGVVWVRSKARIDGHTVFVTGYLSFYIERSRELIVRLPPSVSSQSLAVFWVNPDGSRVLFRLRSNDAYSFGEVENRQTEPEALSLLRREGRAYH